MPLLHRLKLMESVPSFNQTCGPERYDRGRLPIRAPLQICRSSYFQGAAVGVALTALIRLAGAGRPRAATGRGGGGTQGDPTTDVPDGQTLPEHYLRELRRSRRHPRITYFLYLHCRRLRDDLAVALAGLPHPIEDVLDLFCGPRPYEDMLPAGARCVGFDIDERYGVGVADVVSSEFLPFEDDSFDLVMCTQAFYYLEDSERGVAEISRVLRPGGSALITTPFVWPYHRGILEHRFTGPELEKLFSGWNDVCVVENGGRGTSWATLTGHLIRIMESGVSKRVRASPHPLFAALYVAVNTIGIVLDSLEGRYLRGATTTLPQNLLLTARKPE
jgi:Methyltransferase domain